MDNLPAKSTAATQAARIVNYRAHDGQDIKLDIETCKQFLVRGNAEFVTRQEFIYFMGVCKSRALNPFAMDCYLVKYSPKDNAAIIVSRGHYQTRARQQPDCKGWKNGIIVRKNGNLEYREGHLILDDEELVGGWAEARPHGWDEPKKHTIPLKTYIKKRKDGTVTQFWMEEKQPMMIEKVAEVQLLRTLWSREFANLYLQEEIVDSMIPETPTIQDEPKEDDLTEEINKEIDKEIAEKKAPAVVDEAPPPASEPRSNELIEMFDAVVSEKKIPEHFVDDFLFEILGKTEYTNLPELKISIMEKPGAIDQFVKELEAYAEARAAEELLPETVNCHKCKTSVLEDLASIVEDDHGDQLYVCEDCLKKEAPSSPEEPEEAASPSTEPVAAYKWKPGVQLPLEKMKDNEIVNTFINLRTSKQAKLGLKGWIRDNPGWVDCGEFVREKLILKWRKLYNAESLDDFMAALATPKVRKIMSEENDSFEPMNAFQVDELRNFCGMHSFTLQELTEWAVVHGLGKGFGEAGGRISKNGAAYILQNPDQVATELEIWMSSKDENA